MISVSEAKDILNSAIQQLKPVTVPLNSALGLVLSQDIIAPIDVPSFNQSAMDGYAFRFDDWNRTEFLTIEGIIPAGDNYHNDILSKQAVRIFTGSAIPADLDTVVMQEKVVVEGNQLIINDDVLEKGDNVRLKGSAVKHGVLALERNTQLSPAAIGFLAGLGVSEVSVYPKPKIIVVITGNELVQPGNPLQFGLVYESNSFALTAALQQLGINNVEIKYAKDNEAELKTTLLSGLNDCDVLLITGGVSVGDYDFVANTLIECGVKKLFHRIKQKPGKPLFVGKKGNKLIFGLPGNPSSVLTCFYEYVVPSIETMMHKEVSVIKTKKLQLNNAIKKKSGLTHFLKANCAESNVTILNAQESYRLSSFATANCLVCLDEEGTIFDANAIVEVHILPF